MRDFSWKYFSMTGDVDAYILYRQVSEQPSEDVMEEEEEEPAEEMVDSIS